MIVLQIKLNENLLTCYNTKHNLYRSLTNEANHKYFKAFLC